MKQFETYFTENEILRQICKIRVKMAKTKSKKHLLHLLTSNVKYNYHLNSLKKPTNEFEEYNFELTQFLSSILPGRKKWVRLGSASRMKSKIRNEKLTSNDVNFYSLLKTIKLQEGKEVKEQWYLDLQIFINEIIRESSNQHYLVKTPLIFPKLKEKLKKEGVNECRPICIFNLKDRIILSITNKFLTRLFDDYFQDSSYAFRSKKNDNNKILSHHDCIIDILKFRNKHIDKELYVAECDMKKFYDTVNHKIAESLFEELISKVNKDFPELNVEVPKFIFKSYLRSFAFNINIPKSDDSEYWKSYKIINGEFSWIESSISEHYTDISNERIGVPQGGALSGLIANIYLNQADLTITDKNILYQRFCDDMIIISDNLENCTKAKNLYEEALMNLKLFPHKFKNESELMTIWDDKLTYKPFWNGKSKGPYKWGKLEEKSFPWIGFVGYEINYKGKIRVRKKSFEKELQKQKTIVKEIKNAIQVNMRKPKGTATESAINRLIGMSVGRIGLDNFEEVSTDLCWKNGFRELTINEHSTRQIKQLDRNRNKLYYKLLKEIEEPEIEFKEVEDRQVIKYNKPFSYYYQILERQRKANG
ncbi:MAG TPA: reverse transcriptase domain-containing protein [Flavobacterium sp.]|nr:reverse transcriptase domain-containing protein [Flavobacterium sp.]